MKKLRSHYFKSVPLDEKVADLDSLIDYHKEFLFPETEVSFHWWGNTPSCTHHHNYYEFFFISQGKILHILNNVKTELPTGTLVMLRMNESHSVRPIAKAESLQMTVGVTENKLKKLTDALSSDMFDLILNEPQICFVLTEDEQRFLNHLAEKLDYITDDFNANNMRKIIVEEIIVCFLTIIYQNISHTYRTIPTWFNNLLRAMNSPKLLFASVSDIAKYTNYSKKTLVSYFKKYKGETIISYQNRLKVNYACNLLSTTNMTTLAIANRLMYSSLTAFNTMFKKYIGMTPKEYRNRKELKK